jgi:hypothetical protein
MRPYESGGLPGTCVRRCIDTTVSLLVEEKRSLGRSEFIWLSNSLNDFCFTEFTKAEASKWLHPYCLRGVRHHRLFTCPSSNWQLTYPKVPQYPIKGIIPT